MNYKKTTQVPNYIMDTLLSVLSEAELKVFLVINRQTLGWLNQRTGKRKKRDRILSVQFQRKTGFSRRVISSTIKSLVRKQLIEVTDREHNLLLDPNQRKGKTELFYGIAQSVLVASQACALGCTIPAHGGAHNKTNDTKRTVAKPKSGFTGHISHLLPKSNKPTT